jgi:hypothetical protein
MKPFGGVSWGRFKSFPVRAEARHLTNKLDGHGEFGMRCDIGLDR